MAYPLPVAQGALVAKLEADAALMALVSGVYDQVPQGTPLPHLRMAEVTAVPQETSSHGGWRLRFELQATSRHGGKAECHAILARLHTLLQETDASVSGYTFIQSRVLGSRVAELRDGEHWRGTLEAEWLLQQSH